MSSFLQPQLLLWQSLLYLLQLEVVHEYKKTKKYTARLHKGGFFII